MAVLKTHIWLDALRWRVEAAGASIFVVKRGDSDFGTLLLKVSRLDGTAQLLSPTTSVDGEKEWIFPLGPDWFDESRVDQYMMGRREDDPDLWLIEIEDREGRHFLTEPVEKN